MNQPNCNLIIAFDSIFEQCALAILRAETLIYHECVPGARDQTRHILPMLERALQQTGICMNEVSAWAFNRGPGAFSGIRINTAVVQALSVVTDAPCVGVSSLAALAFAVHEAHGQSWETGTKIASVIDARQDEVYLGYFSVCGDCLLPSEELLVPYGSVISADVVVGDGAALIQTQADVFDLRPDATHIARLALPICLSGQAVSAEQALPVYLRHNAWKTLAEQGKE